MWIVVSVAAAALWGFSYAMSERFLKQGLSPAFIMLVQTALSVPLYGTLAWKFTNVEKQVDLLRSQPKLFFWVAFMAVCYLTANLMVFWSIGQKNATVVSLIEISYPLFTAAFAWILFNQIQMNTGIAVGAAMIIAGVFCVGYFGK
jgi:drug/metabolite transporter (DMT)-like permease